MIDKDARNRLLQGIDDLMDEKIEWADFADLVEHKIVPNTKDTVIHNIYRCIEYLVFDSDDDFTTIRLQSNCTYWKFFNRCRLFLTSDADYQEVKSSCSRVSFPIAEMLILICGLGYWAFQGFNPAVGLLLYLFCGVCYFIVLLVRLKMTESKRDPIFEEYPFESFVELLELRRSVPTFQSKRFPNKTLKEIPVHPFIKFFRDNWFVRFLYETKCPVWVDYVGYAFVISICCILAFLCAVFFWLPVVLIMLLFTLLPGKSREQKLQKLVIPCVDANNS